MKPIFLSCLFFSVAALCADTADDPPLAQDSGEPMTKGEMIVHDPVMIREDGVYYLFTTGPGITVWKSDDMKQWVRDGRVFEDRPEWADEAVPGFNGHIWAPDISYYNGKYYLYYSISAFGKNTSCMGLTINKTLDRESPEFRWEDQGIVLQSFPGMDNWNAIDPHVAVDEDGQAYLAFGSFWSGLKMARLSRDRKSIIDDREDFITIASRNPGPSERPEEGYPIEAGRGAIEGPFIFKKGDDYYLFASTDYCCRGADSTYKMIVGRSKKLVGPYRDRDGVSLNEGGGTVLLTGDDEWYGVGHNSVYEFDGVDYLIFHGYDAKTERALPKLHIEILQWDDEGWPFVKPGATERVTAR